MFEDLRIAGVTFGLIVLVISVCAVAAGVLDVIGFMDLVQVFN